MSSSELGSSSLSEWVIVPERLSKRWTLTLLILLCAIEHREDVQVSSTSQSALVVQVCLQIEDSQTQPESGEQSAAVVHEMSSEGSLRETTATAMSADP